MAAGDPTEEQLQQTMQRCISKVDECLQMQAQHGDTAKQQAVRIEAARVEQEKVEALMQQEKEAQDDAERVRQAAEERELRDGAESSRMQRELDRHVQHTAELERTRIDLENKLAKSEQRAHDLEDQVARMSSLGKEEVERLQRDLDQLRGVDKERNRLQAELAETQREMAAASGEHRRLELEVDDLNEQVAERDSQLRQERSALQAALAERDEAQLGIEQLCASIREQAEISGVLRRAANALMCPPRLPHGPWVASATDEQLAEDAPRRMQLLTESIDELLALRASGR